jgi:hypothetical protein
MEDGGKIGWSRGGWPRGRRICAPTLSSWAPVAGTPGTAAGMPATGRGAWLEDRRPRVRARPRERRGVAQGPSAAGTPGAGAGTPGNQLCRASYRKELPVAVKPSMRCRYASRSWRLARPAAGHGHGEFLLSIRSSAPACWYC